MGSYNKNDELAYIEINNYRTIRKIFSGTGLSNLYRFVS